MKRLRMTRGFDRLSPYCYALPYTYNTDNGQNLLLVACDLRTTVAVQLKANKTFFRRSFGTSFTTATMLCASYGGFFLFLPTHVIYEIVEAATSCPTVTCARSTNINDVFPVLIARAFDFYRRV